ncbi:hatching enzyme 1.2-like [Periplaneta americana]|uniref:hatching enzyme 1.2-like n=1 Tax=Periplaneta americana TaxID=6978 RepID=UPI0037E752FB
MKALAITMVCIIFAEVEQHVIRQYLVEEEPPRPKHRLSYRGHSLRYKKKIARRIAAWSPQNRSNVWELSGHYEGDIIVPNFARNGVINESEKWPHGIIPYYIKNSFTEEQKDKILKAMDVFNKHTCVQFRPYKKYDRDFIVIQSNDPGCYSYVGRLDKGQVVNFHEKCLLHGTLMHEFLHVLGFYHQHSATERDHYIKINWENIKEGRESQFTKVKSTSFGEPYDYKSVMHYSPFAFSKNMRRTIEPLEKGAQIGQREGISKIDLNKVIKMYGCKKSRKNRFRRRKYVYRNSEHWKRI